MSSNRITILHDSFGRRGDLRKDWGFAALVEFGGRRILFDAGNDARTFAENTDSLGVDLRSLDFAVVSHRHGDHTSGLDHLLRVNPTIAVYTPDETYGVFGSTLPGAFYPRRPALPLHMQYYDGHPPETIRHGTPWSGARFVWTKETTELVQDVWVVSVVSDVPGTREMRELSLALRTSKWISAGGRMLAPRYRENSCRCARSPRSCRNHFWRPSPRTYRRGRGSTCRECLAKGVAGQSDRARALHGRTSVPRPQ